jgi:Tfp pilus assembly protein PilX
MMAIKLKSTLKNQSGAALVIALIIMIVLTLIGLASTFTSTFEIRLSGNKRGSTDAFYTTETGIQATLSNPANFTSSSYTLIPNSGSLPADLRNESIDKKLSTPVLWLPAGVNFDDPPRVTIYHSSRGGGAGTGTQAGIISDSYIIDSVGRDQIGAGLSRSTSELREKWVMYRLDDPNIPRRD